jgi:MFS family permease
MQTTVQLIEPLPIALKPAVKIMLNIGHAIDHMFLLIFATAVTSIAREFGFANWTDLMPYSVGAFALFGLGALPAGRLGDLWGRRPMMIIFFIGMGLAALLTALSQNAWQLAACLTLMGAFAAIYHPVGIPMLVQNVPNPGAVIGVNGLAGNLGIACAALLTGLLIESLGWRAAFAFPGIVSITCGIYFAFSCPKESHAPVKGKGSRAQVALSPAALVRVFIVMTIAAATTSLLFNFTTNGNLPFLTQGFEGLIEDPARLGLMLAAIYTVASFAQLIVGKWIDQFSMKKLQMILSWLQIPLLIMVVYTKHWSLFWALLGVMVFVFGTIPFTDAMIVRYVDDSLRSRVAGMRLTVAFGISSVAVWLLGPVVKSLGFGMLFWMMAGIATVKALVVMWLPDEPKS